MRHLVLITLVFVCLTGFDTPAPTEEVTIIVELEEKPDRFTEEVESRLPRLEIIAEYDTIFNGVAVRGTAEELEKLVRMETVINQYPVRTYRKLSKEDLTFTTEQLRSTVQNKYTGDGVKVGVIDTGIDYSHPDLEKNYVGGFDTVDFDEDPMETKGEGATSHGTHVAGIIAADGEMEGMAPDAKVYAYRALGPGGVGSSVQVIAALEEAVKDGMDVINLSLGNDVNGPDWPTTHAVNKAIDLGTVVVVAAGNSGPESWTVGSPATSSKAITVGASALSMEAPFLRVAGERKKLPLQLLAGSKKWDLEKKYPIVNVGTGKNGIANVRGKIALFERGEIPFTQKAIKAYQAGAVAVLIYNHEDGLFHGSLEGLTIPIPVASLSNEAGEWLFEKAIAQNQWVQTVHESLGDQVAPFSSRGPVTGNWEIKPDILAPGVDILSTVPGGYQALQGTSMAAPHVAGAAALIKEAHPDWTPAKVKAALTSSAHLIYNDHQPFPPTEQGAGFVDIDQALEPSIMIDKGSLAFGKVEENFFREKLPIELKNMTDETMKIEIERPTQQNGESWSVPMPFELKPGEETEVTVELRLTSAFLDAGIHEGYLRLKGPRKDHFIPYAYVKEQSNYNKVSGFELVTNWKNDDEATYRFHLAEEVEKVTVDLYRAGTFLRAGTLLELENPSSGMIEGEVDIRSLNLSGNYLALIQVNTEKGKDSYAFPVYVENK